LTFCYAVLDWGCIRKRGDHLSERHIKDLATQEMHEGFLVASQKQIGFHEVVVDAVFGFRRRDPGVIQDELGPALLVHARRHDGDRSLIDLGHPFSSKRASCRSMRALRFGQFGWCERALEPPLPARPGCPFMLQAFA